MKIFLADLSHKYQKHTTFPYPVGLIAAYTKQKLGDKVSIDIFKDFNELGDAVNEQKPDLVGFTNYMWNSNLSFNAAAVLKKDFPNLITVAGGANYHDDLIPQTEFLSRRPQLDFYIFKEGEMAFTGLVEKLIDVKMDVRAIKENYEEIPSIHYMHHGKLVRGQILNRVKNLDEVPSPYLSGTLEKFFERDFSVLIQRTRGCPFTCTFCNEGTSYFAKVNNFSVDRFAAELEYCAKRLGTKSGRRGLLHIADANFGMFQEDELVADRIASIRKEYGWPKKIEVPTGKNKKERVLSVIRKINACGEQLVRLTASVQSTDETVLKNIKRSNISVADLIGGAKGQKQIEEQMTQEQRDAKAAEPVELKPMAYGEVILCLPGDNFDAHRKTLHQLIDDGIQKISHQYLTILPGTEMHTQASRDQFNVKTAFRIMPGAYGDYMYQGKQYRWFETEERAIANDTMTFDAYLKCVEYDLVVETFYNDYLFDEYLGLLRHLDIPLSQFVDEVFNLREKFPTGMQAVFDDFAAGRKAELHPDNDELIARAEKDETIIEKLVDHENHIALGVCRGRLLFGCMEELHQIANQAVMNAVKKADKMTDTINEYLNEAFVNSESRKSNLLEDKNVSHTLHFDFIEMNKAEYNVDPFKYRVPSGMKITYKAHPDTLKKSAYLNSVEPDLYLRWRKLLFEPRVDRNDEYCRMMVKE